MILDEISFKKIEEFHENCIGCEKCSSYCSFNIYNNSNPKDHSGQLVQDHYQMDVLSTSYDCTSCGYCEIKCPKGINYKDIHNSIKENIFTKHKKLPNKTAEKIVDFHQNIAFHKFSNHSTTGFTSTQNRKVFFPGCALIANQPEIVLETFEYLQSQNDNIGIISYCCGKPTAFVGKRDDFVDKFSVVREQVIDYDIKEIITACPNCYMVLKKQLPDIKVSHISQSLLKYGLPKLNDFDSQQITIHDPCPTRFEMEIQTSVRLTLESLGFVIKESVHAMENTICCGSGGMLRVVSPKAAKKYTEVFLNEFSDNDSVVTYCQECTKTLISNDKNAHHFLNLIFSPNYSLEDQMKIFSSPQQWANRYKYKTNIVHKKGLL